MINQKTDDIKKGIQYLFQTNNTMTIALSATGHGAMECTITNACEKRETILIACNGIWGDRASDMAKRAGINVERLEGTAGVSFELDQIENALKKVLLSNYN